MREEYGLTGSLSRLPGENRNYRVDTEDGQRFVLKIATQPASEDLTALEHAAVERVVAAGLDLRVPRTVPARSGAAEVRIEADDGSLLRGRLLRYVPGLSWCESETASHELLRHLGATLARLDLTLEGLSHPAADRTHRWDLTAVGRHRKKIELVTAPERRRSLEWMFHLWSACAAPRLADLPHSFIHGDANDENVLVEGDRVVGLLDFGDVLDNPTICELAIALAYAMLDREDPLEVGAEVVAGYHEVRPLSAAELSVLFPLICGRLAVSVTVAAQRRRLDPEHPSWFATEERAWRLLESLSGIDPAAANAVLASRSGIELIEEGGTSPRVLLEKRRRHIGSNLSLSYRQPLKIVRGAAQYLYDHRGRPYLDLVNNVCHVGHCHPRVVAAGSGQMAKLNTNTRYLYDGLTEYAERLCAMFPEQLAVCFFVNSGSEANELALRLARAHTGRRDFLVVDGAYHGHTDDLIAISPYKFKGKGGSGRSQPWVHVVPMPDGYRGVHRGSGRAVGTAYGDEVGGVIDETGAPIAGFITESLLSCGGQIIPPPGYLETAFRHVRDAGGVCIVDEVQTGFGRVGSHFWGYELQEGVVPDIVVMGKPIGNGHPLGAVVTTREIADSFDTGMEFFSTFGGNPVSCAVGMAVLDVIEAEDLQRRAARVGGHMLAGLRGLAARHELIGDVRGAGLFIGVELVLDRDSLEPATREAAELIERMKDRGILLSTDGPYRNVLKIKPPLVIDEDDADMLVRVLDDELSAEIAA